jgi:hypothetical protein
MDNEKLARANILAENIKRLEEVLHVATSTQTFRIGAPGMRWEESFDADEKNCFWEIQGVLEKHLTNLKKQFERM